MTRRGVTLLELLLGLVLVALLAPVGVALLRSAARGGILAATQLARERDATAFTMLLDHDLRHGVRTDLAIPTTAVLTFDRPVGEAAVCGLVSGAPLLRTAAWHGGRAPAAGRDEMLVLVAPEPASWLRRVIVSVGPGSCPDGAPAMRIDPDLAVSHAEWVRVIEPIRLRRYPSGGREWLGLEHRWNGTVVQPFAGPVTPAGVQWTLFPDALHAGIGPVAGITATLRLPLE